MCDLGQSECQQGNQTYNSTDPEDDYHPAKYVWGKITFDLSLETCQVINWCFVLIITPVVGVLGLCGNTISLIILKRSKLDQSSNVLLFCLTVADIFCLVDALNVPYYLSAEAVFTHWSVPYMEAFLLSLVYMIFFVLTQIGYRASSSITAWITIERLLAIFFPLHFNSLVTPTRAWFAGISSFIVWTSWVTYANASEYIFRYGYVSNVTGGIYAKGLALRNEFQRLIRVHIVVHFCQMIPFVVVSLGCIIISIKLVLTRKQRTLLTSASRTQRASNRTTKTLLMVCLVFCLSHFIFFDEYFPLEIQERSSYRTLYDNIGNVIVYINSGFNFCIYIAFNKKFRIIFLNLFRVSVSDRKNVYIRGV